MSSSYFYISHQLMSIFTDHSLLLWLAEIKP